MPGWSSLFSLQDWEHEVDEHTKDVQSLPSFQPQPLQPLSQYQPDYKELLRAPVHTDPFCISASRDKRTGQIVYFQENLREEDDTQSSRSTRSFLSRAPAPEVEVKGSATGRAYWPGGFSDSDSGDEEVELEVDFTGDLLSAAPGFRRGLEFSEEPKHEPKQEPKQETSDLSGDIQTMLTKLDTLMAEEKITRAERKDSSRTKSFTEAADSEGEEEEEVPGKRYKWAVQLDAESEVPDFYTQIVDLAYQFPFELDPFQKQAILRLHGHDNVLVAAHTSAGKTVVAEYAIALSNRHMTKVIYTSPIKALSNQKYRDFKDKFGDVGLLTGDIQLNTTAPCLIMTTEILRSMLYNGSDMTRDLEWVIFDEVHYINNPERGVVWEEVLIMLPEHVSVILLSATVNNANDFAEWVGNTKRKKVYVVKTTHRPVPLEHYLYTGNSDKTCKEIFKIVAANDPLFKSGEYEKGKAALAARKKGKKDTTRPGKQAERNTYLSFVRMLERENLLPAVLFILSKQRINDLAEGLFALDLTVSREKGAIRDFVTKCVGRLKGTDRDLPQIVFLKEFMIRGIAIHHSGVLPLMKEVTELLFERGLIKLLLATETFAMGINMPTRTVVFDSIEKFDGNSKRLLETSEYIQMAGRAGRRGLDETGTVVIMCKGKLPGFAELTSMVQGKATDLASHFKPTYNMILSVLKGKDLKVEEMLKRSFAEYEGQVKSRVYKKERKVLEKKLASLQEITCAVCKDIDIFYMDSLIMVDLECEFRERILGTQKVNKILHPGRAVVVSNPTFPYNLACVVNPNIDPRKDPRAMSVVLLHPEDYKSGLETASTDPWDTAISSLLASPGVTGRTPADTISPLAGEAPGFTVTNVTLAEVACVLNQKVTADMESIKKNLQHKRFTPNNWDSTPVETLARELMQLKLSEINYDIRDMEGVELQERMGRQRAAMSAYSCHNCVSFREHLQKTGEIIHTRKQLDKISYSLSYSSLQFMPEFQVRVQVLKRLRYLGEEEQLKLKGKAACAMSTSELVITELVFDNFFKDLNVECTVAILSCMVFQQRRCLDPNLTPELEAAKTQFLALAHRIVEAEVAERLRPNDADFQEQFRFGLVEVVYRWAKGEAFQNIMQYTDVDEGTIVRCITRLDEVLRCIKDVARIVGDVDFEQKMDRASLAIKRDIVFAASLYVQ